ncbi:hypothetical protein [Mycoplasmopsis cynos]|uniref:hypothetical protein n=1 Tax=Mycoplasmopsis cynos TaxID=171284 RepID=UPI0021FDF58C|nr:hypothetical protein [Mycoplasmopsis cynos]UWV81543.1 hypothetical protein NW065_06595 [Mycoplasmopsis cynos]
MPFFIERVEKHSNQTPQEAGPFPVNVTAQFIEGIKRTFNNPGTTRESELKGEKIDI